jgi:hypothetical protein
MPRNVYHFKSREDVVRFARIFIRRRVKGFEKDINICLTPNAQGSHAYMPGLMTCFALLDLLSGLYFGKLDRNNHVEFTRLFRELMPGRYDEYELKALYVAIRHKLAHFSHPYFVLNTALEPRLKERPMLLSWTISEEAANPPLQIVKFRRSRLARVQPVPWKTRVDHRIEISIRSLADDAIALARTYTKKLESAPHLWEKFRDCMSEFYQR